MSGWGGDSLSPTESPGAVGVARRRSRRREGGPVSTPSPPAGRRGRGPNSYYWTLTAPPGVGTQSEMPYEPVTPFDSIEGAAEYVSLLLESVEEAREDIDGELEKARREASRAPPGEPRPFSSWRTSWIASRGTPEPAGAC